MTPEERAERSRLNRILNNEEYGPKLVRLGKGDQRRIFDLIERGDPTTRSEILRLDEARRASARKPKTTPQVPSQSATRSWRAYAEWMKANVDPEMDVDEYVHWALQNSSTFDKQKIEDVISSNNPVENVKDGASLDVRNHENYSSLWYHYYT